MLALLAYDNPPSLAIPGAHTYGSLGILGFLSRLLIMPPPLKTWCSLPCVEASGFETIRLASTTLWLWIGALIVRYTLDAVCGTNPFDDPTGAYGENPEWERSSRIHLLSVAKENFLLRSETKDFLHKHLWGPRNLSSL